MIKPNIKKSYEDALSDFVFDAASKLGGGLPTDYFFEDELTELERIFKKLFDANKEYEEFMINIINKV